MPRRVLRRQRGATDVVQQLPVGCLVRLQLISHALQRGADRRLRDERELTYVSGRRRAEGCQVPPDEDGQRPFLRAVEWLDVGGDVRRSIPERPWTTGWRVMDGRERAQRPPHARLRH